jgi:predicted ArsR family transcriptional regulator
MTTPAAHQPTPPDHAPVWSDEQWQAVSSPHRTQILHVIDGVGRASIKDLSDWTGRTGTSLYPHLDILERAQFVTVETEVVNGRPRRIYCAGPALKWRSTRHGAADTGGRAIRLAVQLLNDVVLRLRRWGKVREGMPADHGPGSHARMFSETTWLDDEQRAELNRRANELIAYVREARAQRRGRRHSVTLYHFPDVTLREARGKQDPAGR